MIVPETEIVVSKDGVEILRRTVRPGDYVVGREPGCDVQVEVELVSRRHAQLTVNFDHALIEDLGSSNGTFVNGQPVTEATRLWPNQKIKIGAATIEVRRLKAVPSPDVSLAPQTAAVQRLLPEELLREKKYDIGKVVAQGGMGAILDVRDAATQRGVAMKVMLDSSSPDDLSRFVAEARITAQLEHPSIVPIYELSVDENGQPFYTMKMVRGITLRKVLELLTEGVTETVKKYPLPALLTVFQKVCDALAFAHSKGVIHRDLKPENIMLDDFGVVLVMDWGLAKVLGSAPDTLRAGAPIVSTRQMDGSGSVTMAGAIMGTPQYMAPEQARGEIETLDQRADIYALGAILYHILALRPSVLGDDAMAIVEKVAEGKIERLTAPKPGKSSHLPGGRVPESLAAVVSKALAFDKGQRYGRVEELQSDCTAYQNGFATSAEKAGLGKQLSLLVKRHRFATGALALIFLLTIGFMAKVIASEQRARAAQTNAEQALADLRKTAPTFFEQARFLTDHEQLPEALEKIDIALKLNPNEAGFQAQRGNILQSMERFSEAADAYAAALRLIPNDATAKANIELSRSLAAAREKDGALSVNTRMHWRDALSQQGRAAEAILAGRGTATDAAKMMPAWQAKLDAWLGKNAPRLHVVEGLYDLDLINLSLTDLSPLRGMPLRNINISSNPHLKDLSPLIDCPLVAFTANHAPDLVDLSPLKGKKLRAMQISETGVRDLTPLAGMPLEKLEAAKTEISDLTPLHGTKLRYLIVYSTAVRSLEPLRGLPLESLSVTNLSIASLAPVGDAPLAVLNIQNCGRQDLAALRTHDLRELYADGTTLDHLELLAEMTALEVIVLPKNLADPGVLRKLPHLRKIDTNSGGRPAEKLKDAAEFWKEYDAQQAAGK